MYVNSSRQSKGCCNHPNGSRKLDDIYLLEFEIDSGDFHHSLGHGESPDNIYINYCLSLFTKYCELKMYYILTHGLTSPNILSRSSQIQQNLNTLRSSSKNCFNLSKSDGVLYDCRGCFRDWVYGSTGHSSGWLRTIPSCSINCYAHRKKKHLYIRPLSQTNLIRTLIKKLTCYGS